MWLNRRMVFRILIGVPVALFVGSAMIVGFVSAILHPTGSPSVRQNAAPPPHVSAAKAPAAHPATRPGAHHPAPPVHPHHRSVSEENTPWDREYARLEPVVKKVAGKRLLELGLGTLTTATDGRWMARLELYAPRDAAGRCTDIATGIMARRPEIKQVIASVYSDRQQDRCVFSAVIHADGNLDVIQSGPVE